MNPYDQERAAQQRYLATPEWRELREKTLERDQHLCQKCKNAEAIFVIHISNKTWMKEQLSDLISLCENCKEWDAAKKRVIKKQEANRKRQKTLKKKRGRR